MWWVLCWRRVCREEQAEKARHNLMKEPSLEQQTKRTPGSGYRGEMQQLQWEGRCETHTGKASGTGGGSWWCLGSQTPKLLHPGAIQKTQRGSLVLGKGELLFQSSSWALQGTGGGSRRRLRAPKVISVTGCSHKQLVGPFFAQVAKEVIKKP